MAVSVLSFSFSRAAQQGGPGAQLSAGWWLSLLHLISNCSPKLHRGFRGTPSAECGFPYHIVSDVSDPQLIRGPKDPLRQAFSTTSNQQLLWTPTHQRLQGPPPPGFLYHILSAISLDPNSSGVPKGPPPPGFFYHTLSATSLYPNSSGAPRAPLHRALSTTSYQQLLWTPTHRGPKGPLRLAFSTTSY